MLIDGIICEDTNCVPFDEEMVRAVHTIMWDSSPCKNHFEIILKNPHKKARKEAYAGDDYDSPTDLNLSVCSDWDENYEIPVCDYFKAQFAEDGMVSFLEFPIFCSEMRNSVLTTIVVAHPPFIETQNSNFQKENDEKTPGHTLCSWYFFQTTGNEIKEKEIFLSTLKKEVMTNENSTTSFQSIFEIFHPRILSSYQFMRFEDNRKMTSINVIDVKIMKVFEGVISPSLVLLKKRGRRSKNPIVPDAVQELQKKFTKDFVVKLKIFQTRLAANLMPCSWGQIDLPVESFESADSSRMEQLLKGLGDSIENGAEEQAITNSPVSRIGMEIDDDDDDVRKEELHECVLNSRKLAAACVASSLKQKGKERDHNMREVYAEECPPPCKPPIFSAS